ncbi:Homeobox domain [Carpediemonas membranifera]|uniref:Homeobox domain n=1 Tax=Carpediemonas membranifera TaxID=201153 RepID=A0A8J6B4A8_9EUKA|nr:Homeobox domain [Carpediemonas membranifera]|eukprot:KAG9392699.1 Homeobox domain [Carpediemonas membranifera]
MSHQPDLGLNVPDIDPKGVIFPAKGPHQGSTDSPFVDEDVATIPPVLPPDGDGQPSVLSPIPKMPAIGKARISKRKAAGRRGAAFSTFQTSVLVHCFKKSQYPRREEFENIARFVGLEADRVRGWFQNSRTRGVPAKAKVDDIAVPAEAIMDGLASRGAQLMPPPGPSTVGIPMVPPVARIDEASQCDIVPSAIQTLYLQGAFDEVLRRDE